MIEAETFISGKLRIEKSTDLAHYHPRVMSKIMNRHHRNVIFAAFFSYLLLLVMGVYMEVPFFRIPAGAGFLLLFAIVMGFVGAFKYFMRSWEAIGWVIFALLLSVMVHYKLFDLRSIAYGLNYQTPEAQRPVYNYTSLKEKFTPQRYYDDQFTEEKRLKKWKKASGQNDSAVMVIIISSGGGSRSSYWTLHCLQYLDSLSNGNLFKKTVLISGASGGMIGASYWRGIHDACQQNLLKDPYDHRYLNNMGKDLLNSIIFSFASVDLISPFNKISLAGYSYTRDRGYAMEQEMIANTEGVLDHNFRYFKDREAAGQIPQLVVNSTVVNDGRKLMMSSQPISYLTMPSYALKDPYPVIDAIDYSALFEGNDPLNLRLTSALRMNATFPFVLPVVRLPTNPYMNIMDAGLRDNFGVEIANRYVQVLSNWIRRHVKSVIVLEVRDTREYDVSDPTTESSLGNMMVDPFFAIQNKWECFQSYKHAYIKDHVPGYIGNKIKYFTLAYVPREQTKYAALNFHLTRLEKEDLYESLFIWENKHTIDSLAQILR
jgi:hypothetical protein